MFVDSNGELITSAKAFEEDLLIADIDKSGQIKAELKELKIDYTEEIYQAWSWNKGLCPQERFKK